MAITPFSTYPQSTAPITFSADMDTHIAELSRFVNELNAAIGNLNSTALGMAMGFAYGFSTTTANADPGAGTLRLNNATQNLATAIYMDLLDAAGVNITGALDLMDDSTSTVKGLLLLRKADDPTKYLLFALTAMTQPAGYRTATVAVVASSSANPFALGDNLVLTFTRTGDMGSYASVGDHVVSVHTGNGHGSINTCIRRYTTTLTNVGTAITYADSATLGASFTINETGLYEVQITDYSNTGAQTYIGASLNTTQPTTSVATMTIADRLGYISVTSLPSNMVRTVRLAAGAVVRPHTDGAASLSTAAGVASFTIRKVAT